MYLITWQIPSTVEAEEVNSSLKDANLLELPILCESIEETVNMTRRYFTAPGTNIIHFRTLKLMHLKDFFRQAELEDPLLLKAKMLFCMLPLDILQALQRPPFKFIQQVL